MKKFIVILLALTVLSLPALARGGYSGGFSGGRSFSSSSSFSSGRSFSSPSRSYSPTVSRPLYQPMPRSSSGGSFTKVGPTINNTTIVNRNGGGYGGGGFFGGGGGFWNFMLMDSILNHQQQQTVVVAGPPVMGPNGQMIAGPTQVMQAPPVQQDYSGLILLAIVLGALLIVIAFVTSTRDPYDFD